MTVFYIYKVDNDILARCQIAKLSYCRNIPVCCVSDRSTTVAAYDHYRPGRAGSVVAAGDYNCSLSGMDDTSCCHLCILSTRTSQYFDENLSMAGGLYPPSTYSQFRKLCWYELSISGNTGKRRS